MSEITGLSQGELASIYETWFNLSVGNYAQSSQPASQVSPYYDRESGNLSRIEQTFFDLRTGIGTLAVTLHYAAEGGESGNPTVAAIVHDMNEGGPILAVGFTLNRKQVGSTPSAYGGPDVPRYVYEGRIMNSVSDDGTVPLSELTMAKPGAVYVNYLAHAAATLEANREQEY